MTATSFTAVQDKAIRGLTSACFRAKAAGIPLSVFSGAVMLFPNKEQDLALAAFGRAAKTASKVQLQLRVTDKELLVINLAVATAPAYKIIY